MSDDPGPDGPSQRLAPGIQHLADTELTRTAYQKKAVSKLPPAEVLDFAVAFFAERGYKAGRTGRPGQVFVMGKAEGTLPRVTGEVAARADVGKPGTTLVTMDAAGERLGPLMAEFAAALRAHGRGGRRQAAGDRDDGAAGGRR